MKYKIKSLSSLGFLLVLSVFFSFSPKLIHNFQDPKLKLQDTTKNDVIINDSLKIINNLKLKLVKKDAHASYYADKFTGRRTASGKIFDNKKYTAAHRKLPFGTKLKVTNEANKKFVIVVITDRGPFIKGRDIDLSKKAFMDIASKRYGGSIIVTLEKIQ